MSVSFWAGLAGRLGLVPKGTGPRGQKIIKILRSRLGKENLGALSLLYQQM